MNRTTPLSRRELLAGTGAALASMGAAASGTSDWSAARHWQTAEQLLSFGFRQSRVVMMNEAHAGDFRCVRTRVIGRRVLNEAHKAGVRHLAMEAITPGNEDEANRSRRVSPDTGFYFRQRDMRALAQRALDLEWTLLAYEAHPPQGLDEMTSTNWREEQQARNLVQKLRPLGPSAKLLVWCGNSHLSKVVWSDWLPMGYCFVEISGIEHFAIDQTRTVTFPDWPQEPLPQAVRKQLEQRGKTAGLLRDEMPARYRTRGCDGFLLSLDNEMTKEA